MVLTGEKSTSVMNVTTQELVQLQSKTVSLSLVASADVLNTCNSPSSLPRAGVKPAFLVLVTEFRLLSEC